MLYSNRFCYNTRQNHILASKIYGRHRKILGCHFDTQNDLKNTALEGQSKVLIKQIFA